MPVQERDLVSVKDFGAKGDGVTDDTEAFSLAQQEAVNTNRYSVYVPPGTYIADVIADNRVNFIGERNLSWIIAATEGGFAMVYPQPPPYTAIQHQRPFVYGLGFQGTLDNTQGQAPSLRKSQGLKIENFLGVDLVDVHFYRCTTALKNSHNFYGSWDRLMIVESGVGIHFAPGLSGFHAGNKRLINPHIRQNNIGIFIEAPIPRLSIYGGTIEGHRCGIVSDYGQGGAPDQSFDTANGLHIDSVWFEANQHSQNGDPFFLSDGTEVLSSDLFVNRGSIIFNNPGLAYVYINELGKLYTNFGFVGRGPTDAFVTIAPGGVFVPNNTLV